MVEGAVWFVIKGVILTEVFTNAAREWGIFDSPRQWLKARSRFLQKLLDCFECSSVWAAGFVFLYLSFLEVGIFTYALIFHRVACFIKVIYMNLDWMRAHREEDFMRKVSGKEN